MLPNDGYCIAFKRDGTNTVETTQPHHPSNMGMTYTNIQRGQDKELRPDAEIVKSLIALRDELFAKKNLEHAEIFYKINSCLYSGYERKTP